jgi:DNA-directed RNA polymerase subunit RPC12/RpoP
MNCGASLKKEEPAPEPAKPAENKCPACGAINREGAHFCMQCGKKLQ